MKNLVILLDADEVIFDFIGGASRLHGIEPETLQAHRTPGHWPINNPLGELIYGRPMTQEEFWSPINAKREEFWENLDRLPWFDRLITLVESFSSEWHIVSAPSLCPTSYNGKVRAFKKAFGSNFNRFVLTPHKHLFAKPSTILIDDRDENVIKFNEYGGTGLVFPTIGNSLYAYMNDPVDNLAMSLESLLDRDD